MKSSGPAPEDFFSPDLYENAAPSLSIFSTADGFRAAGDSNGGQRR
jgi:hypothetical protein